MKRTTPIEIIRRRFTSADFSGADASDTPLDPCAPGEDSEFVPIPHRIEALIAQRQAARDVAFHPIPLPGQIVRVPPRPDDAGNCYNEYLAVLLDGEIAVGKWRGWLVGRDPEYACEWDLILGPEEEPRDPMCQLVQVWNPVALTIQEADRVLAELSAERLSAARALARDHANKLIPAPIDDHRMGVHLARELSDGTGVVTGTTIAGDEDPRNEYQELFRKAGVRVSQGVQSPSPRPVSPPLPGEESPRWRKLIWIAGRAGAATANGPWRFGLGLAFVIAAALVVITQAPRTPEFQVSIVRHSGGGVNLAIPGYRTVEVAVDSPVIVIKALDPELTASSVASQLRDSGGTVEVKRRDGTITVTVAGVKKPSATLFKLLGHEAVELFKAPIVSIVILQAR